MATQNQPSFSFGSSAYSGSGGIGYTPQGRPNFDFATPIGSDISFAGLDTNLFADGVPGANKVPGFNLDIGNKGLTESKGIFANLFGKDSSLVPGLDALGSLYGAYLGNKQVGLNEDAFNFNKGLKTTQLANNASITNAQIADQARTVGIATGLTGEALETYVSNQSAQRNVSGTIGA